MSGGLVGEPRPVVPSGGAAAPTNRIAGDGGVAAASGGGRHPGRAALLDSVARCGNDTPGSLPSALDSLGTGGSGTPVGVEGDPRRRTGHAQRRGANERANGDGAART